MKSLQAYLVTKARQERWQRKKRMRKENERRAGWSVVALLVSLICIGAIYLGWQYSQWTANLPAVSQIPAQLNARSATFTQPTRLVDRSGTVVVKDLSIPGIQRKYMQVAGLGSHISPDFVSALIALEEPGFWQSNGMDWSNFDPEEHGTIAQRLVYQILLKQEPPSFQRALREKLLAGQVVSTYGREQVLEWYINSLDFGHLAYGVEAGARLYLDKSSANLTLPEAALLAGVAIAPALNPWDSPAGARALEVEALKTLALQGKISTDTLQAALTTGVEVTPSQGNIPQSTDPFADQVMAELDQIIGRERVERGGLTVQTTLDSSLQDNLECAVKTQLQSIEGNQESMLAATRQCEAARLLPLLPPGDSLAPGTLESAVLVSDPSTGQVLAMTGEITSNGTATDLEPHPGGTILTPFVYLTAFSQGLSPASMVWDAPEDGSTVTPISLDGTYHGPVRMRIALANDYLQPVADILNQVGRNSFNRLTTSMGLNISSGETTAALLNQPVTLLELATAYDTLAADGVRHGIKLSSDSLPAMNFVLKVWDENGAVLYDAGQPESAGVISSQLAYLMNATLSDDFARQPTLGNPSMLLLGQPSAAKVGQRLQRDEVWTAGYTPERTVVVWMGTKRSAENTIPVDARWSMGIWRAVMQTATDGLENQGFTRPAGVSQIEVCDPSGLLPTHDCPSTVDEVFIDGNDPTTADTLYHRLQINAETGRLATVFTPAELLEEKVFLQIPTAYQSWAQSAGISLAPNDYDVVQNTSTNPAVHFTSPAEFAYVRGKVEITGTASANNFESYEIQIGQGLNPTDWQQIKKGSAEPVVEDRLAEWDTTGLNGLYVIRLQVVDTENRIQTALLQVSVDNTPPQVSIQYPQEGTIVDLRSEPEVFIKADVPDSADVAHVEIWIDEQKVQTLESAPYFYNWQAQKGNHVLQAVAVDQVGNLASSSKVHFEVQ